MMSQFKYIPLTIESEIVNNATGPIATAGVHTLFIITNTSIEWQIENV